MVLIKIEADLLTAVKVHLFSNAENRNKNYIYMKTRLYIKMGVMKFM